MDTRAKLRLFLKEVKEIEGGKLHRNKTEEDITTGYGVYFKTEEARKSKLYTYILNIGKGEGLSSDTSKWTDGDCKRLNALINAEEELELTVDFYMVYFKSLGLEGLHQHIFVMICSLFVNSRKLGVMVLQRSVNEMRKILTLDLKPVAEDGLIGPGTRKAVQDVTNSITDEQALVWNGLCGIIACQEYKKLVDKKPSLGVYYNGWTNRVLENMRDCMKPLIG